MLGSDAVLLCAWFPMFLAKHLYPVTVQYLTAEDLNTGSSQSDVVCSVTVHNKHGFETRRSKI